jgi:hypothetical protein
MYLPKSLLACFALFSSYFALADTLLIDVINTEPANSTSGLLRPHHGQTMLVVESKYGAPDNKSSAIGNPPISRWTYPEFSVYFETNHVIHSVVNKPKKALN